MLASEFPHDYDKVTSFSQVLRFDMAGPDRLYSARATPIISIDDGLIGEIVRLMIQC